MNEASQSTGGNLFAGMPVSPGEEYTQNLSSWPGVRIERIVSRGQSSEENFWYDQPRDEWVLLVRGAARLRLEDRPEPIELRGGDWLLLPAHCRHRVEWTDPHCNTVWLAIHVDVE
jgi:cupin 2 domain-containing protein